MTERRHVPVASTVSLRPKQTTKLTYAAQRALDTETKFLQKATQSLTRGTVKDIDQMCQLARFEKFQYSVEEKLRDLEEEDATRALEDRRQFRDTMLQREREKAAASSQATQELTRNWASTQQVKKERMKSDVRFEMAMQKIADLKTLHHRLAATIDERSGIDFYEKNLKKMGIGGDADNIRLSISYEAPDVFEQRLQSTFEAKASSNEEIQSFLNQLKERTAEKRAARYEKARRRRRALAGTS